MNFFQLVQLLISIAHAIQTVESVMPNSPGAVKLKAATDSVVATVDTAASFIPQVQTAISGVVSIFNATKAGAFADAERNVPGK